MKRKQSKLPPNQVLGGDSFFKPKVQAKLAMGTPGDKYEIEADHMADQVVNKTGTGDAVQKMEGEEEIQQKPLAATVTPLIQKMGASEEEAHVQKMEEEESVQAMEEEESVQKMEEEEAVQAMEEEEPVQKMEEDEAVQAMEEEEVQTKKAENTSGNATIEGKLRKGNGGTKMDVNTQTEMEAGFGADFSNVNIHNDSEAAQMSQDIGAQAFTHGNDVYFNEGKYNPDSKEGKHLLAHELTHTIQQTGMVQRYRNPGATNFKAGDSGTLKESSFNPKTDKKKKPWIHKIYVTLNKATVKDAEGIDTHKGSLVAKYYDNSHKLSDISFPVTAGSSAHKSSEANHLVHRIEGLGYMSSAYSDSYTPNPDNPRYNKDATSANMHYAVFYKGAQAIHGGSLDNASHGCLHVADFTKLKQLNYHSVKGLTAVIVKYV